MIRRRVFSGFLALFLPAVGLSQQDTAKFPIYFTISGGIAAGSYQSGQNWALLQAIRLSESSAWRSKHFAGDRAFALGGMTGASAGNINAVLTALEYCRDRIEKDPRKSLFWSVWIPTGFSNMLKATDTPAGRTIDRAIFDRRFFDDLQLPPLSAFGRSDSTKLRKNCRVPLGITVTRQLPNERDVVEGIRVPVTRNALTFTFNAQPERTDTFRYVFTDAAKDTNRAHFGDRIWLASTDTNFLSFGDLYEAIKASSAFPVAFAPVKLAYSKDPLCRTGGKRCASDTALFVDGGVFDNNPLDVMVGLRRKAANPEYYNRRSMLIYLDQDEERGVKQLAKVDTGHFGLRAIFDLASSFYSVSRSYELQSLSKSFHLNPDAYDVGNHSIQVSDRRFAVIGREYGAFAAFFGRPFREFDFYLGVYDGIYAAARLLSTAQSGGPPKARSDLAEPIWQLIVDTALVKYDADRQILLQFHKAEFGGDTKAPPPTAVVRDSVDKHRLVLYSALAKATFAIYQDDSVAQWQEALRRTMDKESAAKDPRLQPSKVRSCSNLVLGGVLCEERFGRWVEAVATDEAEDAAARIVEDCEVRFAASRQNLDCTVDDDFTTISEQREHGLFLFVTRAISRLRANEANVGADSGSKPGRAGLGIAGLMLNQQNIPYRHFWTTDASTIPRLNRWKCARCWLPYRLMWQSGSSGFEIDYRAERRSRWIHGAGLLVTATPLLHHRPPRDAATTGVLPSGSTPPWNYVSLGAGFILPGVPLPVLSFFEEWEIQARGYHPWRWGADAPHYQAYGFDITSDVAKGRLQIGARWLPDNRGNAHNGPSKRFGPSTLNGGNSLTFLISVPDIPGLAYWLFGEGSKLIK
jgi:hypothetical protein